MNQTLEWVQTYQHAEACEGTCENEQFNVFEVLGIAEEVEHKAARFLLQAAARFDDTERWNLCYNLASWRSSHHQA